MKLKRWSANAADYPFYGGDLENWVIAETIKQLVHGDGYRTYFWRDNIGNEVDLFIRTGRPAAGGRSQAGATLGADQFKGLRYYRKLAAASGLATS